MTHSLDKAALLVLLSTASAIAQSRIDPAASDMLASRVRGVDRGDITVQDAAVQVFKGSEMPGGIELLHCVSFALVRIDPDSSVRAALEQITSAQGLSVNQATAGMINLRERQQPPQLLDVRIATVEIPSRQSGGGAYAALRRVLQAPEVRKAVAALGLHEVNPEFGFTNLPKNRPATDSPTVLRDLTVRDALNYIALESGRGVWVYDEQRCLSPTTFTISFPVQ